MRTVGKLLAFLVVMSLAVASLVTAAIVAAPASREVLEATEAEEDTISLNQLDNRSIMFDKNGNQLAVLHAEQNRAEIALSDIPDEVIESILAVEDQDFYDHKGINLGATMRALFWNVSSGGIVQGGSTITQQLVKNAITGSERNADRKITEAALAWRLEKQLTKDQILERYLNTVYFGGGAYGVQAAAELYWGKNAQDLGWAEGALLASLISNPTNYDPTRNPEKARIRRSLAVKKLVSEGLIDEEQAAEIERSELPAKRSLVARPPNGYFETEVVQLLLDDTRLGATAEERRDRVFRGGLRIHTTYDPVAQFLAVTARDAQLSPAARQQVTAAIASVEPSTGAIRALVGGPGFEKVKFNLATQGSRQPGSSFKLFVLLALLENGYVLNDTISAPSTCNFTVPVTGEAYQARGGGGQGTLTRMFARSSNCGFLRLGLVVGDDKVIDVARRMGISTPLEPFVSTPLGTQVVHPIDMAGAYAAIANDGLYNEPYYIDRVEDRFGNIVFEHESEPRRVVTRQTARSAIVAMREVIRSGTGTRAALEDGRPVAGKTGTAGENTDAWFVGFTPQLATAVWVGNPLAEIEMNNVDGVQVTGGSYPARIWSAFMSGYHRGLPVVEFREPSDDVRRGRAITEKSPYDPPRKPPPPPPVSPTTASTTPGDTTGATTGDGTTPTTGTGEGTPPTTGTGDGGGDGGAGGA